MQKFEELTNRQQQEKLAELERYTVQLIRDEFGRVLWCDDNTRLATGPGDMLTTPKRVNGRR